jgi:hypothetical protein
VDARLLQAERQLDIRRTALERAELHDHHARRRGTVEDAPRPGAGE